MNDYDQQTKPQIGIMPEKLWKQKRAFDLIECLARYSLAGLPVQNEWLAELGKLLGELFQSNK
jgi:hypothetical protein